MSCRVRFEPSDRVLDFEPASKTLLELTREAGLPIASACGENGACARCGLEIVEGADGLETETEREQRIKTRNRIEPHLRLACRVRPTKSLVVRATYW